MKKRLKKAYETYLQGKMDDVSLDQRLQSYLGILSHANQHILSQALKNAYWVRNGIERKHNYIKDIPFSYSRACLKPNTKYQKKQWPFSKTK